MCPVESEADRASFFDEDEFAQVAEILGRRVPGYFEETTTILDDIAEVPVQSTDPTFTCAFSAIPKGAEEGTPLTITRDDGTIFTGEIVNIEPDGFGLALLNLQDNG